MSTHCEDYVDCKYFNKCKYAGEVGFCETCEWSDECDKEGALECKAGHHICRGYLADEGEDDRRREEERIKE